MEMIVKIIRKLVPRSVKSAYKIYKNTRPLYKRLCPLCNYEGNFIPWGKPIRIDAKCPNCGASERHRLFWLWLKSASRVEQPILHFAAESVLEKKFRHMGLEYKTADLFNAADMKLNIESIELDSNSVGTIICNHVLEHVDDKKALSELFRIVKPGGMLIASVPIIEAWDTTYENEQIQEPNDRELHFGQSDHIRFYGRDFIERLSGVGWRVEEFTGSTTEIIKYGLIRGEKIFLCTKEAQSIGQNLNESSFT